MKEHLEIPLRKVVESLSSKLLDLRVLFITFESFETPCDVSSFCFQTATTGETVKLPGRERGDPLEQAVALVEASSASAVSLLKQSKETLERILTTLKPRAQVPSTPQALLEAFDPEDDPIDDFSKKQQKSAFVSLVSLVMAHGDPINLEKVTSSIPLSSGQPVDPRSHMKYARKYCDKILDVLAEYNEARRKVVAASSGSAATKAAGA